MLKVEDLKVNYDKVQVLRGVSLNVNEGEIVTLIGSNGAGKTTLLRTISGIKSSEDGTIEFQGEQIGKLSSHKVVERGIAHVPEGRQVFADMTVRENLEMGAYRRKDRSNIKQDIEDVYELFPRLREREKQLAGTMSGGEQQMLAIGRAMMAKPKLFIFDEPSLGIAPIIVQEIAGLIVELNKKGATILLVEQNANLALKISHRAYIMENGTIGLEGKSSELLNDERVSNIYLGFD